MRIKYKPRYYLEQAFLSCIGLDQLPDGSFIWFTGPVKDRDTMIIKFEHVDRGWLMTICAMRDGRVVGNKTPATLRDCVFRTYGMSKRQPFTENQRAVLTCFVNTFRYEELTTFARMGMRMPWEWCARELCALSDDN